MKTYILQLEPHDDVLSARDKMTWSKAPRMLLVWPRRGKMLRRRVDLVLLQRQGERLGAQIALVTRDRVVLAAAKDLGIPVFTSPKVAQRSVWQSPHLLPSANPEGRKPADPVELREESNRFHRLPAGFLHKPAGRLLFFTLGLLAVMALVLFFYPSAQVTFSPAQEVQTIDLDVWASPDLNGPNPSSGIPAREVTVVVEGVRDLPSTGSVAVPNEYASGMVHFTNLTSQDIQLPAGSVVRTLSTPPLRFETTQAVLVPSGPDQVVEAPVRAMTPGRSGNVAAEEIQALEGETGLLLMVTNPKALQGGIELIARAPAPGDYSRLRDDLLSSLKEPALNDLQRKLNTGQTLLPETLKASKVLEEKFDPPEGQPADRLRLSLRVEYTALAVQNLDLQIISVAGLNINLKRGYRDVPETLVITNTSAIKLEGQSTARWQIRAERKIEPAWSAEQVTRALQGRRREEAAAVIRGIVPLQADPQVILDPPWWVRMPYLTFRIEVAAR